MALAALRDHRRWRAPAARCPTRGAGCWRSWCWARSGFVSLEAGWLVTEWGRQPWIVRGLMRTADAVTPTFRYKAAPFWLFTLVYVFLGVAVVYLLARQIAGADEPHESAEAGACRLSCCWRAAIGVALVLYFLFGGADFGGGVWDLLASGPRAAAQRARDRTRRSARSGRRTTSG